MKVLKSTVFSMVLFLCSAFAPVCANAAGISSLSLNPSYGSENSITDVRLNIQSDGISAYSAEIRFDPRVLYFTGAEQGNALNGGVFYCNDTYSDNVVRLVWSHSRNQVCNGAAAVLHFRAAAKTAETDTVLSIGHAVVADDIKQAHFNISNCTMKIAGEITKGDVNGDGYVNVSDIISLNLYLLNRTEYPLSYTAQACADVSGNGNVTTADGTLIMNYISNIIKEL